MAEFVPPDGASSAFFCAFAALMFAAIAAAVFHVGYRPRTFALGFALYLIAFSAVIWSGLPLASILPALPLLFAVNLGLAVAFAFSPFGTALSRRVSLAALVGFQAFRLPLELLLHHWAEIGTVPPTMTWTGQNWDIVAGAVALLAFPFAKRWRGLAWATQIVGFALLMNVLRVVVMSSPLPFAWPLERPMLLAAYMPYALILPLFVAPALAAHLVAFRRLTGE